VARPDDEAALEAAVVAAGWQAEWALPPPRGTLYPPLGDGALCAEQEKSRAQVTPRRSLYRSKPKAGFGETTLHQRWLKERKVADPADFGELDKNLTEQLRQQLDSKLKEQQMSMDNKADKRVSVLGQKLAEQLDTKLNQVQVSMHEQQTSMDKKVTSLDAKMERLITLVSAMQPQPE
jgi:uncharacterized coiled-coil protein SlyX